MSAIRIDASAEIPCAVCQSHDDYTPSTVLVVVVNIAEPTLTYVVSMCDLCAIANNVPKPTKEN